MCWAVSFSIGLFMGASLGMLVMALVSAGADTEEQEVKQDADR